MTTKHTPGPWNIASVENSTGRIKHLVPIDGKCLSLLTVVENDQAVFAAVYNDSDARLIAAAPDLLEALTEQDRFLGVLSGTVPLSEKDTHRRIQINREGVRAAIAKATGSGE